MSVLSLGYGLGLYQGPFHVRLIYAMYILKNIFSSYMIVKKCIFIYSKRSATGGT